MENNRKFTINIFQMFFEYHWKIVWIMTYFIVYLGIFEWVLKLQFQYSSQLCHNFAIHFNYIALCVFMTVKVLGDTQIITKKSLINEHIEWIFATT